MSSKSRALTATRAAFCAASMSLRDALLVPVLGGAGGTRFAGGGRGVGCGPAVVAAAVGGGGIIEGPPIIRPPPEDGGMLGGGGKGNSGGGGRILVPESVPNSSLDGKAKLFCCPDIPSSSVC